MTTQSENPDAAPPPPRAPASAGPTMALPTGALLGATAIASAVFAGGSWLLLRAIEPAAALRGPVVALGLGLVFAGSLLLVRPWRRRPMAHWPALWLAGRMGCFLGTVVFAAALLYSAPQGERLTVGLLVLAGYALLFVAESIVAARAISRLGVGPSG